MLVYADGKVTHVPVIRLEMMSGRINIFNILMRMSPGKAITMTMSGWMGEATRSSIPETAPKTTPEGTKERPVRRLAALSFGQIGQQRLTFGHWL